MIKIVENKEIMGIVERTIAARPELGFNQILHGLNIVDSEGSSLNDEPEDVLIRIKSSGLYFGLNNRDSRNGVY